MRTVRLDITRPHDAELGEAALKKAVGRALGVPAGQVEQVVVLKRALDARARMGTPTWRFTVDARLQGKPGKRPDPNANVREAKDPDHTLPSPRAPAEAGPVVVVGAGPAGLFAAWQLAEHGAKVVLIERGKPVETRARDFGLFRGRAILNPESNICFGEGGAGTYSDGKLTCRTKDPLRRLVLERLVEVVFKRHGVLDKFIGDALMASWGTIGDEDVYDSTFNCVAAAIEFRDAVRELNEERDQSGLAPIMMGVGVNTGSLVAGYMGSRRRLEFTVIGDTVNTASRVCGIASGDQVLISDTTYRYVADRIEARYLGTRQVKGKEQEIGIYEAVRILESVRSASGS
ncbi:MAG: FAD-dependent oxidoreductase [Myxococcales bacterium]|nr:FAD-dependent oxidoreductase [Myxococcales bacterium]